MICVNLIVRGYHALRFVPESLARGGRESGYQIRPGKIVTKRTNTAFD